MKNFHSILFFLSVFVLLGAISFVFPKDGLEFTLRFPSFEDILLSKKDSINLEDNLLNIEQGLTFVTDSTELFSEIENTDSLAFIDSLKFFQNFDTTSVARIYFPNDNPSILDNVFEALDNTKKNGYLHILHYGDSQIEVDRISGYLREALQERFGGYGAGLIPIMPLVPSTAVGQTFSDSLPRYVASGTMRQKLSHNRYGILEQMCELKGSVSLHFVARNWKQTYAHTRQFYRVRLFLGNNAKNFSAKLIAKGIDSTQVIEEEKFGLSEISWSTKSPITECTLNLKGNAELYAVSLESSSGVVVDNIPLRGSAGTFFTGISSSLLKETMTALKVPMIIMEYGGNAVPSIHSLESVQNYKKDFGRQIRYVKNIYPNAFILVIGPADMSTKFDGVLQTWPFVEEVVEAMKEVALENGAAFWNMFEVMGGRNSMIQWVSHKPAWAGSDYIHFTPQGASKIASLFTESFLHYYDYYKFLQRNSHWLPSEEIETPENWAADSLELSEE